jgi:hypothetical protein
MWDCHGKSSVQQKEAFSFHQQIGIKFKEETSKLLHLECSFVCGAEIWILLKVDQK